MGSADSVCLKDDCPDEAELRALLNGGVNDPDRLAWMEGRLTECEGCRERLERLGVGDSETVGALANSGIGDSAGHQSDALKKAVARAKAGEFAEMGTPDPSAEPDLDFLEPGSDEESLGRLGKYEVAEVIAEGGMGLVLRAEDPDLHREVAIKVLSPRLAARQQAREMFLREARAAAGIEHENVLPIYLVENSGELPWFVMPLVRGGTVEDRIETAGNAGLDFDEVLDLSVKTARGLAAAHDNDLIHRDIKPANIMLDGEGVNVWLADFGLAAAVETETGGRSIAGTPGFMAPEVVAGGTADEQSDLFSLGCVLFALVTGRHAFSGDTVEEVLESVKSPEPAPKPGKDETIPAWFGELISRLLAKSPDDRLASADELVGLLETQIEERRKAVWRARLWRRVRRGLATAAIFAALIGGALWLMSATGRTQALNGVLASVTGDAFSVRGRIGVHDSLGDAIAVAKDEGVVEIFGRETWDTPPVRIEGKSLTIRAAPEASPVLRASSQGASILWTDSNLSVEGIVLEQRLRPKKGIPSLISMVRGELRIENCRLLSPERAREPVLSLLVGLEDSRRLEIANTEIQARHSFAIGFRNRQLEGHGEIRMENVLFLGPLLLMLVDERAQAGTEEKVPEVSVNLEHCTVMSGTLIHIASRGTMYPVSMRASHCAFDCEVGLITTLGKSEEAMRQRFDYEDEKNVYAVPTDMFVGQGRGTTGGPLSRTRPGASLGWDEVKAWWGLEVGESLRVERIVPGGLREQFTANGRVNFEETSFENGPGKAGALVEQLGPGTHR